MKGDAVLWVYGRCRKNSLLADRFSSGRRQPGLRFLALDFNCLLRQNFLNHPAVSFDAGQPLVKTLIEITEQRMVEPH